MASLWWCCAKSCSKMFYACCKMFDVVPDHASKYALCMLQNIWCCAKLCFKVCFMHVAKMFPNVNVSCSWYDGEKAQDQNMSRCAAKLSMFSMHCACLVLSSCAQQSI